MCNCIVGTLSGLTFAWKRCSGDLTRRHGTNDPEAMGARIRVAPRISGHFSRELFAGHVMLVANFSNLLRFVFISTPALLITITLLLSATFFPHFTCYTIYLFHCLCTTYITSCTKQTAHR